MKVVIITLLSAATLIIAALIVAKPWVTIKHPSPITVKGYAEMNVKADTGSLKTTVRHNGETNAKAYTLAGESLDKVRAMVRQHLGDDFEIVELATKVTQTFKLDANGKRTNTVDYYTATRTVRVNTTNVVGLEKLGRALYDLNAENIPITVKGPEYFVSNLNDLKFDLVEKATANGKQRAEIMANSSGEAIGSLLSARQGVIQVTKPNSTETSSWGVYDTETIEKVVKLVVTVEYEIGG